MRRLLLEALQLLQKTSVFMGLVIYDTGSSSSLGVTINKLTMQISWFSPPHEFTRNWKVIQPRKEGDKNG